MQVDAVAASQKEARCGRSFGRIVHRWRATTEQVEIQRQVTMVATVAKFWGKTIKQRELRGEKEEEQDTRRKQRLHQEGRQRNRWKKVGKAAVQGEQQTERARVLVLARERSRVQRAEQGQLLLEAADRGVEGVRLRGVLARALYNWGLGHARDRARYMEAGVRGDMKVPQ